MKIVLAEKVSPATLAVFKTESSWTVLTHDQLPNGLAAELADADGLVVRSAVQANEELLSHAPNLRVIGRAGVGVDNIDAEAATRRGIVVMNTPGANAIAVAELSLCLMLALARKLPVANATMHEGKWEKKSLQGTELRGKTLGILGLGRIGLEVARRARAFQMELIAHDPFVSAAVARENGIKLVTTEELFANSAYLSLHVGLTPQTTGIINEKTIATMKKGVRIINCARGELIKDEALVAALKAGQVAGAALDVFAKEPPKDSPYFGLDNVILTPHIAGSTAEAQEAVGIQIAKQVREYLKLGVVQNAVNLPSLTHEEYVVLSPFIQLAQHLGEFVAQGSKASVEGISIGYTGVLAETKTELVRNAAIQGVLAQTENVNRINAAAIAEEHGIRLHETKTEGGETAITITLNGPEGTATAKATVLYGDSPRLVSCDGIDIEIPLEGTLLLCRNLDVPGVIGRIGTILGDHKVNIANFALGRAKKTSAGPARALAVIQVDEIPSEACLEALRSIEALLEARVISLSA